MPVNDFEPIYHGIEVVIKATWAGAGELRNVLHCVSAGVDPTPTEVGAAATAVATWCIDHYAERTVDLVHFYAVDAYSVSTPSGPYATVPISANGAGNSSGVQPDWAGLVLLGTALRGPGRHGRIYLFPPNNANYQNGNFTDNYWVGAMAHITALRTALDAASVPLGVGSRALFTCYPVTGQSHSARSTRQKRRRLNFGA